MCLHYPLLPLIPDNLFNTNTMGYVSRFALNLVSAEWEKTKIAVDSSVHSVLERKIRRSSGSLLDKLPSLGR